MAELHLKLLVKDNLDMKLRTDHHRKDVGTKRNKVVMKLVTLSLLLTIFSFTILYISGATRGYKQYESFLSMPSVFIPQLYVLSLQPSIINLLSVFLH